MFPIRITLSVPLRQELANCEFGSYEDCQHLVEKGEEPERSIEHHAYIVASRPSVRPNFLEINNLEEAEEIYYAVCSGTFQSRNRFSWHAANRIADTLRYVVRQHKPELVQMWSAPYERP